MIEGILANPACRFYVEINGNKQAVFTEVSGLGMEMVVEEVEEGGNNDFVHKLPGRCKFGNLTLKSGMTNSDLFLKWIFNVARGKIEKKNLSLIMFDPLGRPLIRWQFTNAFPIKWTGPQFKADDTAVAIESLELAHEGFFPS